MKLMIRSWMIAGSICMLLGCSTALKPSSNPMEAVAHTPSSPVMALDVSEQGQLKVAALPAAGSIQILSVPSDRKVVLLGETFVKRYGIISTKWHLPEPALGSLGDRPLIALVKGEASHWIAQQPSAPWLGELVQLGEQLSDLQRGQEGRLKDRLLPYMEGPPVTANKGGTVRAAAMSGQARAMLLTERELQLLSCLNGQRVTAKGEESMSCRVQWRSNGELQAPKLLGLVDVSLKPMPSANTSEIASVQLQQELTGLVHELQANRTDPLDIGLAIRSQYRGVWTTERWHEAFARAEIQMKVRVL